VDEEDFLKLAALIGLLKQADHDIEFQSWWDVSEH